MRISTNTIYQLSSSQMTALQEKISQTSQQASTGKKVMTPQDDPVGSAKLLEAKQAISINDQYAVNRNALKYTIGIANVALNGVQDVMQSMNEQIVSLGNGTLSNSNRQSIALTMQSQLDHLVSLSKTKAAPQLNLFGIGFPITIGVGFLMLSINMPYWSTPIINSLDMGIQMIRQATATLAS